MWGAWCRSAQCMEIESGSRSYVESGDVAGPRMTKAPVGVLQWGCQHDQSGTWTSSSCTGGTCSLTQLYVSQRSPPVSLHHPTVPRWQCSPMVPRAQLSPAQSGSVHVTSTSIAPLAIRSSSSSTARLLLLTLFALFSAADSEARAFPLLPLPQRHDDQHPDRHLVFAYVVLTRPRPSPRLRLDDTTAKSFHPYRNPTGPCASITSVSDVVVCISSHSDRQPHHHHCHLHHHRPTAHESTPWARHISSGGREPLTETRER